MISELKKQIDLPDVVRSAGVEVNRSGFGLCPFHDEKTPSFKVYPNRVHCYGCGFDQDSIGFVMKLYKLSFPEALKFLGIDRSGLTPKMKAEIQQRKRKAELVRHFRLWAGRYGAHMGTMINRTERLMKGIPPEDLHWYAPLLDMLPVWEYHSNLLLNGSEKAKFQLYKEARRWMKNIST